MAPSVPWRAWVVPAGFGAVLLGVLAGAPVDVATLGKSCAEQRQSARGLQRVDENWLESLFDASFVHLVAVFVIEMLIVPRAILFLLWRL